MNSEHGQLLSAHEKQQLVVAFLDDFNVNAANTKKSKFHIKKETGVYHGLTDAIRETAEEFYNDTNFPNYFLNYLQSIGVSLQFLSLYKKFILDSTYFMKLKEIFHTQPDETILFYGLRFINCFYLMFIRSSRTIKSMQDLAQAFQFLPFGSDL